MAFQYYEEVCDPLDLVTLCSLLMAVQGRWGSTQICYTMPPSQSGSDTRHGA